MSITIHRAVSLKPKFWKKLAFAVVKKIKAETKKGVGAEGEFKKLSNRPSKWVAINVKKSARKKLKIFSYKEAKAADAFPRQMTGVKVSPTDLRLTGDMMRDLKMLGHNAYGMKVGWAIHGAKVQYQADQGRPISTEANPTSEKIQQYVFGQLKSVMKSNLMKATKTTKLKIG